MVDFLPAIKGAPGIRSWITPATHSARSFSLPFSDLLPDFLSPGVVQVAPAAVLDGFHQHFGTTQDTPIVGLVLTIVFLIAQPLGPVSAVLRPVEAVSLRMEDTDIVAVWA